MASAESWAPGGGAYGNRDGPERRRLGRAGQARAILPHGLAMFWWSGPPQPAGTGDNVTPRAAPRGWALVGLDGGGSSHRMRRRCHRQSPEAGRRLRTHLRCSRSS